MSTPAAAAEILPALRFCGSHGSALPPSFAGLAVRDGRRSRSYPAKANARGLRLLGGLGGSIDAKAEIPGGAGWPSRRVAATRTSARAADSLPLRGVLVRERDECDAQRPVELGLGQVVGGLASLGHASPYPDEAVRRLRDDGLVVRAGTWSARAVPFGARGPVELVVARRGPSTARPVPIE
jgi:hypothetical protein